MTKEQWKDIRGTDGLYKISDRGRVASRIEKPLIMIEIDDQTVQCHQKSYGYVLVKATENISGTLQIKITVDGIGGTRYVANLVASHFLPPPEFPDMVHVRHVDGSRINCHVSNLEWYNRALYNEDQRRQRRDQRRKEDKKANHRKEFDDLVLRFNEVRALPDEE
jgi:hypothetical protein